MIYICIYIYICVAAGHSLGGVMAVIAAWDIARLFPWGGIQVYTMGAPRPGNRAFANAYHKRVPATFHVINEQVRLSS